MLELTMNKDSKLAKIPMMPMLECEGCPGKGVKLVCKEDPDLSGTSGVVEYVWKKDMKPLVDANDTMISTMRFMVKEAGSYTCMTKRSNVTSEKSDMLKLMIDSKDG